MALVLEQVSKVVGREHHLRDLALTIEPGSFNVVLGRTLAGKTSLLRLLAGLDRPSAGRIVKDGRDITRTSVRQRSVAMVYQQFVNYPSFTVRANIASPLRLRKAPDIDARVGELAAMLGLGPLLDRLPAQLSGGQQQRVAIARALAKDAELLLLDEPLVNLDYKLREGLRDELRAIFRARATTVLYATTEPAEALALGGHTILLHEGRALQHAPTLDVYHRPASAAAARVFSDPPMSLFEVAVGGGAAILGELRIPLPAHLRGLPDGTYRLGIRASDCSLSPREGLVPVRGEVELNEISGSETLVYLRHGEVPFIVQVSGVFHHEQNAELTFYLDPGRLLAFQPDGAGALVASYR
ncbi:MAG TPA: ABC transporter ATP-binding protein [Kofleriaceae bacterium]|nr:ABC transporter ATP-binding protein [Kofleriaceae bacterium]